MPAKRRLSPQPLPDTPPPDEIPATRTEYSGLWKKYVGLSFTWVACVVLAATWPWVMVFTDVFRSSVQEESPWCQVCHRTSLRFVGLQTIATATVLLERFIGMCSSHLRTSCLRKPNVLRPIIGAVLDARFSSLYLAPLLISW